MKLSRDELAYIMTFCDKDILKKVFKNYTLLEYSYRLLEYNTTIANSILEARDTFYKKGIVDTNDILSEFIDTSGFQVGSLYKDDIFYDGRLESIFTVRTPNTSFMLPKNIGRLWMGKSYETYASMSIIDIIRTIILPWLQDKYDNFINLSSYENLYLNRVYDVITNHNEELPIHSKITRIMTYLYSLYPYIVRYKGIQFPLVDKKYIRKIARIIAFEKSKCHPLYGLLFEKLVDC